jgi:hypothetical protein
VTGSSRGGQAGVRGVFVIHIFYKCKAYRNAPCPESQSQSPSYGQGTRRNTTFPDLSARHAVQARPLEQGFVLIWAVMCLAMFIVMMALTISIAQGHLAKKQLQISADAGARAAMKVIRAGRSRLEASEMARRVAIGTSAMEAGIELPDEGILFGDFDYRTGIFRELEETYVGTTYAAAVQVKARRGPLFPGGPIELQLQDFLAVKWIEVGAQGTASTGCREIVFVLDVSSAMMQEIDDAYRIVFDFMDALEARSLFGDKIGMDVYAGDVVSMRDYAEDGGAFWVGPVPDALSAIPGASDDVDTWLAALEAEESIRCPDKDTERELFLRAELPTRRRGSCLGKGDHWGIQRAIRMFEDEPSSCSADGERLIILITSSTPCLMWGGWIGDWFRFYGGTLAQAYAAADEAWAAGINIAPILIDNGRLGHDCDIPSFQHTPTEFINNMARGFITEGMINPTQDEIDALITRLNDEITIRIVD